MKSKISICLFFALPFIINGEKFSTNFRSQVATIDELAQNGTKLNGILKLKRSGFLGEGTYGFVYAGIYLRDNRTVAIKFVSIHFNKQSENEFEMYTYLNAINNTAVEQYGLPNVYYRGRWENFTLTAITKLDHDLFDVAKRYKLNKPLDILILFRNFVIQSKYLHSHGIRHDDIKPENIMVRGHQSFLIDFNLCSKMMQDSGGCTWDYRSRRARTAEIRRPIDDWESFLHSMSCVLRKERFKPEIDLIDRKNSIFIGDGGIENVIRAFANEVFSENAEKRFPDYDRFEKLISDEIAVKWKKHSQCPPMFSWLSKAEKKNAKREFDANLVPDIKNINEPSTIDFETIEYPIVVNQEPILDTHDCKKIEGMQKVKNVLSRSRRNTFLMVHSNELQLSSLSKY